MRLQQRAEHGSCFFSSQDVKAIGLLSRPVGPGAGHALPARTRMDPGLLAMARTRLAGSLRAHPRTRVQHRFAQSRVRFEVRQLRPTKPQRDRAGPPRFSVDESARVQRLDHLMHDRRRHLEEGSEIRLGWRHAVKPAVVIDERQILALLDGEGCRRPERRCLVGHVPVLDVRVTPRTDVRSPLATAFTVSNPHLPTAGGLLRRSIRTASGCGVFARVLRRLCARAQSVLRAVAPDGHAIRRRSTRLPHRTGSPHPG